MSDATRKSAAGAGLVWFYPTALAVAAGLILVSVGPAPFAARGGPTPIQVTQSGVALGPAALARGTADSWHNTFIVRAGAGAPVAFRLAVKPGAPEATEGVRFAFAADTAARLEGKAVRVALAYRPIVNTSAKAVAVGLVGAGGAINWVSATLPAEAGDITLDLPATAGVQALAMRAISDRGDFACGLELGAVQLTPS